MWGPWLFYINGGDLKDAGRRAKQEDAAWPYSWLKGADYQNRGKVTGRLVLSDGRPASGAAVFLGDENGWETNNQGSNYQYTTYADDHGAFTFEQVRRQKPYRLLAWANGGHLADVDNVYNGTMVAFGKSEHLDLGTIRWPIPSREIAWRIGDFDRKTLGFKHGGDVMQHGLSDVCPANLVYTIGVSTPSDWYFAQSAQGNWTIIFDKATSPHRSATLTLSFAGYTSQNGYGLGRDSTTLPEVTPTGLNISMNQFLVGNIVSETATDGALYRSATTAGGYYAQRFTIPSEMFLYDKANRLDLYVILISLQQISIKAVEFFVLC
jgi:rhamnogalacturonan endolyase